MTDRFWLRAAYAYALTLALGLGYFTVRMPYQVSDDLEHILLMQAQSARDLIVDSLSGDQSLRPMMWLHQNVLFELAPGSRYWAPFKAFNVAQLIAGVILFVRMLRVRTAVDAVVSPLALAVLVGIHTFNTTMREGYPTNHFMTVLVCCLAVVNLAISRWRWWHDVIAVLIFAYAALTIETGLLVWVCLATAYIVGWRGVSGRAVVATTVLLAAYFIVRFVVLDVGARTLMYMSSGYGFSVRSTGELRDLFGDAPWKFYLYNVVSSVMTVLFSEPRGGVFQFTAFATRGHVPMWSLVNLISSLIGTVSIGVFLRRRLPRWSRWTLEHEDRVVLLFIAVLGTNAVTSYPYTKDVIISPAGVFYAAAIFMATRDVVVRLQGQSLRPVAALMLVPMFVLSAGWTLRALNLVQSMRATAFVNRSDWAVAEERQDRVRREWRGRHPDAERLLQQLRADVINAPVPQPYTMPRWTREWFDPY